MKTKTIISEYSKDNANPFENIVNVIKNNYINVNFNHNDDETLKAYLNYSWKMGITNYLHFIR